MALTNTGSGDSCKCKALACGFEGQLQPLILIVIFMVENKKQSVHKNPNIYTGAIGLGGFVSRLLMHLIFLSLQDVELMSKPPHDNRPFSVFRRS